MNTSVSSLQPTLAGRTGRAWGTTKTNRCPPCWPGWEATSRWAAQHSSGTVCHPSFTQLHWIPMVTSIVVLCVSKWRFLLRRCWVSTPGRGRPSWTQWCVMGCLPKMPSPPSGWSETCEGNLRRSSSKKHHYVQLQKEVVKCLKIQNISGTSKPLMYQFKTLKITEICEFVFTGREFGSYLILIHLLNTSGPCLASVFFLFCLFYGFNTIYQLFLLHFCLLVHIRKWKNFKIIKSVCYSLQISFINPSLSFSQSLRLSVYASPVRAGSRRCRDLRRWRPQRRVVTATRPHPYRCYVTHSQEGKKRFVLLQLDFCCNNKRASSDSERPDEAAEERLCKKKKNTFLNCKLIGLIKKEKGSVVPAFKIREFPAINLQWM